MILLSLLSFLSCATTADVRQTASLVTLNELVTQCKATNDCETVAMTVTGTGTRIIWEDEYYWLTAGHVCAAGESMGHVALMKIVTFTVGGTRDIEITKTVTYSLNDDLCIARAKKGPARRIAPNEPNLSSRVTAIAYPRGIFDHRSLPVYDGRWSGYSENKCAVTIPVVGGSSGAGVINEKGQLVGVIEAVVKDFNHLTIVSCTREINEFLITATERLKSAEALEIRTSAFQFEENQSIDSSAK